MRFALCQLNPTLGALDANVDLHLDAAWRAREAGADLAVFSELSVTGYSPQDMLDRPAFLDDVERAVERLCRESPLPVLVGAPVRNEAATGKRLHNAALLIDGGAVVATVRKQLLPTYDVYDEYRYFEPAPPQDVVVWRGVRLGVHLCEDMWNNREEDPYQLYAANPIDGLARQGLDVFVNLSGSPFAVGRAAFREQIIVENVAEHGVPLVFVNQTGANTELVFDGQSGVWDASGERVVRLAAFAPDLALWDFAAPASPAGASEPQSARAQPADAQPADARPDDARPDDARPDDARPDDARPTEATTEAVEASGPAPGANDIAAAMPDDTPLHPSMLGTARARPRTDGRDDVDDLLDALVLGVADYFRKQPFFAGALVGLSGGIDSALTAAVAVLALGPERVTGVTMPSKYSSSGSVDDSAALARALGLAFHRVPIVAGVAAVSAMLAGEADAALPTGEVGGDAVIPGGPSGLTEENLQARLRGVTLMALSNAHGHLLLTTGNKSEMAVGYATLYGDMCGGLAVLSDVYKTDVYRVARRVNERLGRVAIPESTLTKPPSAELRPDQKDSDSLPPYDVLDPILRGYLEHHLDTDGIVAQTGFDRELVRKTLDLVDRAEFKRRQAAPGLRVSTKAFGLGRRYPVVEGWTRR